MNISTRHRLLKSTSQERKPCVALSLKQSNIMRSVELRFPCMSSFCGENDISWQFNKNRKRFCWKVSVKNHMISWGHYFLCFINTKCWRCLWKFINVFGDINIKFRIKPFYFLLTHTDRVLLKLFVYKNLKFTPYVSWLNCVLSMTFLINIWEFIYWFNSFIGIILYICLLLTRTSNSFYHSPITILKRKKIL